MAVTHTAASAAAAFNATMYKTPKVIFLKQEKALLTDLVNSQLPSDINSKAKQPLVLRRKAKAWELITSAYNATSPASGPRTVKQLQKLWENLTSVAKRNEAKRCGATSSSGVHDVHGQYHQQQHHHPGDNEYRGELSANGMPSSSSMDACREDDDDDADAVDMIGHREPSNNVTLNDMIAKHVIKRRPAGKYHSSKTRLTSSSSRLNSASAMSSYGVGADVTQEIVAMRRREHAAKMENFELEKQKLHIERDYWARRYEQDFGCNSYGHPAAASSASPQVWVSPSSIETVLTPSGGGGSQLSGIGTSVSNAST